MFVNLKPTPMFLFPFHYFQLTSTAWVRGVSEKRETKVKCRCYSFKEVKFSSQMSDMYLHEKTAKCKCSGDFVACVGHVFCREGSNLKWPCIQRMQWPWTGLFIILLTELSGSCEGKKPKTTNSGFSLCSTGCSVWVLHAHIDLAFFERIKVLLTLSISDKMEIPFLTL